MPIVRNRTKNGESWYSVRCDCCGREALNEQSREDAAMAIRDTGWYIVSTAGMPMKDYCLECFKVALKALEASDRRQKNGGKVR